MLFEKSSKILKHTQKGLGTRLFCIEKGKKKDILKLYTILCFVEGKFIYRRKTGYGIIKLQLQSLGILPLFFRERVS